MNIFELTNEQIERKKQIDDFIKSFKEWRRQKRINKKIIRIKLYQKSYRQINKDKLRLQRQYYCQTHRLEINTYFKDRSRNNPSLNMRSHISSTLRRNLRKYLAKDKEFNTMNYVGCNTCQLKKHIESKFKEGMTWQKFNLGEIHLDHIIPCNYFLSQPNPDFKLFYNWRNLQPLWASENCSKGKKLLPNHEELLANLRKEVYGESQEEVKA